MTKEFCKQYSQLPPNKRIDVLKELAVKYNFDKNITTTAAESYLKLQVCKHYIQTLSYSLKRLQKEFFFMLMT